MDTRFSDGLSYLITQRVSVATEFELCHAVDDNNRLPIHAAFAELYNKAEEQRVSHARYQETLKDEIVALRMAIKPFIVRLQELSGLATYEDYLLYRDILSIFTVCPYLYDRKLMYEVIHFCIAKQIF